METSVLTALQRSHDDEIACRYTQCSLGTQGGPVRRIRLLLAPFFLVFGATLAQAHDHNHPELDSWYSSLNRPDVPSLPLINPSCCNKDDCHTTDAEIRGTDWWARLGKHRLDAQGNKTGEWDLVEWVKIPLGKILQQKDSPTGEPVICHEADWWKGKPNLTTATIYCFVRPAEY